MNSSLTPKRKRGERVREVLGDMAKRLLDIYHAPFYFLLAAVMIFVVECLSRRSVLEALHFLFESPLAYLANYGIILCTLLPALIFRKRIAGLALVIAVWTALSVTQCIILCTRVTPFSAVDVAIALSVITIIRSYLTIPQIILIIAAILGAIATIIFLFVRTRSHRVEWKRFGIIYGSAILGVSLTIALAFATGQLSDRFPNLANAYNDYGFPYCFGMSVVDKGVDRPDEYGEELINGVLDDIPITELGGPSEGHDPNVIIVQLESFFDVKYIQGVTYSADPIPTFTALREQYPSGVLQVPVFGAGTVNTEFEVLTGMNVADFGAGEYPFRSIMLDSTCETIAYDLLADGYRTHAIHNHEGNFYMRNDVYKNLGFESFTSIEYFEDPTFNENDWAHDRLLTGEILYLLESTEESDLVFAVSVQGHGKYPNEYEPAPDDVLVTGGMEDDAVRSHYNYYINQLREMDAFIKALYEAVMDLEEDTVLVFYGDHLPTIACDEGITLSSLFETEYIIISNYETEVQAKGGPMATYQIFPTVMEVIGSQTGVMNRFHRAYREDPQYLTLLAALEYDVLYGRRMAYGDTVYPVMENMVMGSRTIRVTGYEVTEDALIIRGENFTGYSQVALDGRLQDTEMIDKNTLRVSLKDPIRTLSKLESITVRQVCAKNEALSETEPYRLGTKQ